jgi:hypothetical protein
MEASNRKKSGFSFHHLFDRARSISLKIERELCISRWLLLLLSEKAKQLSSQAVSRPSSPLYLPQRKKSKPRGEKKRPFVIITSPKPLFPLDHLLLPPFSGP